MDFSVMTFNMDFNKGLKRLPALIGKHKPDILCLQEINTSPENLAHVQALGFDLCDYANSRVKWNDIFGVATFTSRKDFRLIRTDSINLPSGFVEVVEFVLNGGRRQRTVLKTVFEIEGKKLNIINIHLSPYAMNRLRDKQMHETFQNVNGVNEATVMLGDFNYPYNRSNFEEIFKQYGFTESTTHIFATFRSNIPFVPITFKLDYVLYRKIQHINTERVEGKYSDHKPILSIFTI